MTTLVTGATGHLGANLVRALLDRGERVRVLLRQGSPTTAVEGLEVERVYGDLLDQASLQRASSGCDRLYHLAALISIVPADRQRLFSVNVLGTRNLLQAAARAGVERVVHCSSLGAVGTRASGASDEEEVIHPFDSMDYDLTKALAEHEVLKAVMRGLAVTIVNPSGVVGPRDFKPSLLGQTLLDIATSKLPAYVPGAVDLVPVEAVIDGHLRAMEKGRAGERYILSGELVTLDQLIDWVVDSTGARRPFWRVPPRLIYPYTRLKDALECHLFPNFRPRYTTQTLKVLAQPKRGDHSKARAELGYRPGSVREALDRALAWYREVGMLEQPPG